MLIGVADADVRDVMTASQAADVARPRHDLLGCGLTAEVAAPHHSATVETRASTSTHDSLPVCVPALAARAAGSDCCSAMMALAAAARRFSSPARSALVAINPPRRGHVSSAGGREPTAAWRTYRAPAAALGPRHDVAARGTGGLCRLGALRGS